MFTTPDQFSAASKANFDAQLALIASLTSKTFEGIEKIVELNLSTVKASLEESNATTKQLLSAKDPQEFFSLTSATAQPSAEKAIAYGRQLSSIATNTQAELTKTAEEQIAETNRKLIALVDDVTKNAPAGSENVVALFKSAIDNAAAGYDQLTKTTKQAVETIEGNLNSAATQFSQAATKTTSRSKK